MWPHYVHKVYRSVHCLAERCDNSVLERRGSVVASMSACHAAGRGSLPGPGALLGVKTWLYTLEIVYLCVFRMRH